MSTNILVNKFGGVILGLNALPLRIYKLTCMMSYPFSLLDSMNDAALVKKDKLLIVNWLIENFPAAFFKKPSDVKPLQIGIFEDILDFYERLDSPPFSKKSLKEALRFYSCSPAYLKAQQEGVARVDIYGNEVDVVTKEQAKYAQQRYAERYNKASLPTNH